MTNEGKCMWRCVCKSGSDEKLQEELEISQQQVHITVCCCSYGSSVASATTTSDDGGDDAHIHTHMVYTFQNKIPTILNPHKLNQ